MQKSILLIVAFVCVWSSCSCKPEVVELMPPFTTLRSEAYSEVPIIIVGLVLQESKRIGKPQRARHDDRLFTQRFRAVVHIENVLQGNIRTGAVVSIYYFVDSQNLGSSVSQTYLVEGERDVLLLEREYGNLRLIFDNYPNKCVFPVLSGAHPSFKADEARSWADNLTDLLLTRGENVNDTQMIKAVSSVGGNIPFGEKPTVAKLKEVARIETPTVRATACASLAVWDQPCAREPTKKKEN